MDKLQQYRKIIRQILTEQAYPYTYSNDVEAEIICDAEHDRYQLAYVGWKAQQRIFSVILHFDIKDGKIWIQYNGTEIAMGASTFGRNIIITLWKPYYVGCLKKPICQK